MIFKSYLSNIKPSSTLVINELSKEMERKGIEIFKFGFGQSPFPIPENIINELKNMHLKKITYL